MVIGMSQSLIDFCIAQGDDALVLSQRLSEWCYHGPFLEEDLAMSNVALDFVGRAQMFYQYAAELEGAVRSADDIAFLRDCREFRNLLINELPRGDFAFTIARQLLVDVFNNLYLQRLLESSDQRLREIAAKSIKETRYHLRRSHDWVLRLGDGTDESKEKIQRAFTELWGYIDEQFDMDQGESELCDSGVVPHRGELRKAYDEQVAAILAEATLAVPQDQWRVDGGRKGIHTDYLGHMLAEMQFLQRAYPGLEW